MSRRTTRQAGILEMIRAQDRVTIHDIVDRFKVSAVTIRKDLDELEQRGDILRTFGGAALLRNNDMEMAFQVRARMQEKAKRAIGAYAAQMIRPGDSIIIDAGSTALEIVRCLKGIAPLDVITPALNVALEAGSLPGVTVIVPGSGVLDQISMSLEGPEVEEAFSRLHADKYFMGLRSVDVQHGFMDTNIRRIRLKQSMMHAARETIAVADSTKFGRTSLVQIAPLDKVAAIITDEGLSAEFADQLGSRGVNVIAAGTVISGAVPGQVHSPATGSTWSVKNDVELM